MQSRREFNARLLGSLAAFGLIETLWSRDLFADAVKPTVQKWLLELVEMTKDLKGKRLTDLEFQTKMEDLYKRVDLKALCTLIKLDEIEKKKLPDNGASSIGIDKSITITSGREATAMRTPMAPLVATRTRRPWVLRYVEYSSRVAAWSSTTRTSGAVLRVLARVMFHEVYMRASSPSMRRRHQKIFSCFPGGGYSP